MLRKLPVFTVLSLLLILALGLPVVGQDSMSMTAECGADGYTGNWQSLEVVDDMTVKITLCNPDPAFGSKIAFIGFPISPSEYIESTGGGGDLVNNPIGTGPYKLENWDLGNELVLSRFDEYWGDAALEPTVIFRWNAEAAARLVELQAGNVDGIAGVGTGDFEVVEADPNLTLIPGAITNVMYLGLNNTKAPLDNLEVRQAIAHAIDKQRIVDNFYPAGSVVATQFMPPVLFGYTPEVEPLAYDPELAMQMLDEAGFPAGDDGVRFELPLNYRDVVRGYLPTPGVVAADIQAQLAEVGIKLNIEVMESGAFLDASDAGDLSVYLLGWGMDYPDATNFLDFHFGIGSSDQFGEHFTEITDPLTAAAQTGDPDARYASYIEANTALRDLVPMVPIAHGANANAWRASINGSYIAAVGVTQLSKMEDPDDDNIIWMQNAEPISLYCMDETDGETFMACGQINEALLNYEPTTGEVIPWLAESWDVNEDATEWTFHLREGVTFHDGSTLDAADVYMTLEPIWDAASPYHV
ncbi:MAG: peptide ABC transporter substrate-binding protein, partial [Anaerolineae bacterium]|nr:peptide ABC transporter substrate-binding protein [Anaerolineae bacterium]